MTIVLAEPQPWPLRRTAMAGLIGLVAPFALLPWAGGLLLLPYFLAAPAMLGILLAPRGADRNGYQLIGVAAAAGGAAAGGAWNIVSRAGDASWPAVLVGGVMSFLLLSLVPVVVVILVSNRYPKPGVAGAEAGPLRGHE